MVPRAGVSLCRRAASRQHARQHARSRRLNRVTVDASGGEGDGAASTTPTPEQQEEMMKRMAQMREDPKVQEQMNVLAKAMEDEKVQAQIQEAQAQFQSADFQAKVKALQDDPEFKEMFDELKTGGMAALMKVRLRFRPFAASYPRSHLTSVSSPTVACFSSGTIPRSSASYPKRWAAQAGHPLRRATQAPPRVAVRPARSR